MRPFKQKQWNRQVNFTQIIIIDNNAKESPLLSSKDLVRSIFEANKLILFATTCSNFCIVSHNASFVLHVKIEKVVSEIAV